VKENERAARREAVHARTEASLWLREKESLSAALANRLSRPGLAPLDLLEDEKSTRGYLRNHQAVWKHTMRLGVLRQHEPRPLVPGTLPRRLPPAPANTWPLVSIVTPSFQQASFVERTMLSVLEQDYPRVEYHVCDGGSVDGSVDLIRKHEGRLASWSSEGDSGPAEAINRGFARSSGEIMAWLNSDDLLLPGAVRFIADYFARHPEVDVVYGHRLVVDERDWQVGRWVLPRHDGRMLLWADYVPQETLFWRRPLWEKTGLALDQSFKFAFDWDILLRFQKAGARIVRLPWFIGCFRVHDSQKSIVDISTVGMEEMARLRERELGSCFDEDRLVLHVVEMQRKAAWCDRLLRWGLRW
jgi:glycosyltransferase involved in cell wall biosynthesis